MKKDKRQMEMDFDKTQKNIITVKDVDPNAVGAFVWWTLNGPLDMTALQDSWSSELRDYPLPKKPSNATALRRATLEQQNRRRLVRPLADDRTGYAIVQETGSDDKDKPLTYEFSLQVWFEGDKLVFSQGSENVRELLQAAYEKHLDTISAEDVRAWLAGPVLQKVLSVSLRPTGGVYFIPKDRIREFRLLTGAVRHASNHKIFAVPAQYGEDVVEGVLESLRTEMEAEVLAVKTALEGGDIGVRGLATKLADLDGQVAKLTRYEQLLNVKQPALQQTLIDLRAHVFEAQVLAKAEK